MNRKPRADSVLKTLPFEQQEAIFEHLSKHSLEATEAWLATQDIDTGRTALSSFRSWFPTSQVLHAAANVTNTVQEVLRDFPNLNLNTRQVTDVGQAVFETIALQEKDSKMFVAMRELSQKDTALALQKQSAETKARQKDAQIAQKDRDLQLVERRVRLLEENAVKAKQALEVVKRTGGLSPEALRQIEEAASLL